MIWQIRMLGGFEVRCGEEVFTRFRSRKAAMLLAYLACRAGQPCNREEVLERFWPDSDGEKAYLSLRVALSSLRNLLHSRELPARHVLVTDRTSVRLVAAYVSTDVQAFEQALDEAVGQASAEKRVERLLTALGRYGGPLLPQALDDWVLAMRERLANRYVCAVVQLTDQSLALNRPEIAEPHVQAALQADPLCEEFHQALMRLHLAAGRPDQARRQYAQLAEVLRRELGVAPSRVSEALLSAASTPAAASPAVQAPTPVLEPPTHSTSGRPDEPPGTTQPPLPARLNRLRGRESEMADLLSLLAAGRRLISLLGVGGCGKTRLAVEVAWRSAEDQGRTVCFAALADVSTAGGIAAAVLQGLGTQPEPGDDPLGAAARALQDRGALLILDNLEHLLPDASEIVARLLRAAPAAQCLVTSREPVGLAGEQEMPLSPLPIPADEIGPEELAGVASVALFVDRAYEANPEFTLGAHNAPAVAALCRRLEGLPLALELSAAWSRMLTPAQMLARLDELDKRTELLTGWKHRRETRHRSLKATLDWSFDRLTAELQRLLACLSGFRGGWTLEASAAVCGMGDTLADTARLLSASLVTVEESAFGMRYRMLETVRQYAEERREAAGVDPAQLAAAHAAYFAALAREAAAGLEGGRQQEWLARLDADYPNIDEALRTTAQDPGGDFAQLATSLCAYWYVRGRFREGLEWLERVAACPDVSAVTRSSALNGAGMMHLASGSYEAAEACYGECARIRQEMGDAPAAAVAITNQGMAAAQRGDTVRALSLYEEGVSALRSAGDPGRLATALSNLAVAYLAAGRLPDARKHTEEALAAYRSLGDTWGAAIALNNLAELDSAEGDYAASFERALQALSLFGATEAEGQLSACLATLGTACRGLGRPEDAARLLGAAEAARRAVGGSRGSYAAEEHRSDIAALRDALGVDAFTAGWLQGTSMSPEQALAYALDLALP